MGDDSDDLGSAKLKILGIPVGDEKTWGTALARVVYASLKQILVMINRFGIILMYFRAECLPFSSVNA